MGGNSGLWIYDLQTNKRVKVLKGTFLWCSWSAPDISQMAIERVYGGQHHEIWVADLAALGPGRTIEEHFQEMVDYYTRRIDTDPEDAENYLSRAKFYIYPLEDRKKTFADLDKYASIVKDPSIIAQAYGNLGLALVVTPQQVVDPEIAVELFRKAHEMQRENWLYLTGLGLARYRAGQWAEAIAEFTKSTKLPGDNGINFLFLSMALWQSGEKSEADLWHNKAIEWIQDNSIDEASRSFFYFFYPEAAELMGSKIEGIVP
jgi:tetratricopeptide (TPR) repeat protein